MATSGKCTSFILTNVLCCSININIYIIVVIISLNFYMQNPLCSFFVLKYVVLKFHFDVSSNSQLFLRMEELPGKERYFVIFLYILFTFVRFYPPLYQRRTRILCWFFSLLNYADLFSFSQNLLFLLISLLIFILFFSTLFIITHVKLKWLTLTC